ncbi:MAG: nucleoside monophosphate kinase [Candidatus Omnitrophica bacterium]|nr:nucleoside monophosphate kinase [Candidatus Omnitrophota bacterium]
MGARLVLLGPPGAGKGTLAAWLSQQYGFTPMSTGELFRQQIRRRTALGRTVSEYVTSGRLVPDALVVKVMTSQLTRPLLQRGFVLDGFPRTTAQAEGLERFLVSRKAPLTGAIVLTSPVRVLLRRLSGRRVCGRCGAIYHVRNMPPKRSGICDRCQSPLIIRKDDQADTIRERLRINRAQAKPLVAYYRRRGLLHPLRADGSSQAMFDRAARLLKAHGWAAPRPARRARG